MLQQKNKSIVFVISSLSGGGAERVLSYLANHFVSGNYKVDVVYSFVFEDIPAYNIDSKITIHKLPANITPPRNSFIQGKLNIALIIKALRYRFKKLNPDVIISFMDKTNIFSLIARVGLNIPVIISERICADFMESKVLRAIRKLTYPFCDGMVVLSEYDYHYYYYVQNKKIIYNPVNLGNMDVNFGCKEKIILAVGRLEQQKGFDDLIEVISNVRLGDWRVFIIGEGSKKAKLQKSIEDNSLESKVRLLGRRNNIEEYYRKASIFLLTSRYEGFPNALAEAMCYGCACVSFDCKTGPSDIIEHQINGLLVEARNVEQFSSCVTLLINNKNLRQKYATEALKLRQKLNLFKIVREWELFFEQSLQK